MGKKYCKKEANTNINRISIIKKGDERLKERNHKWAGKRGGREYARNKMKLLKFKSYYQLNFQWALSRYRLQKYELTNLILCLHTVRMYSCMREFLVKMLSCSSTNFMYIVGTAMNTFTRSFAGILIAKR
jgi:hypothetical protein